MYTLPNGVAVPDGETLYNEWCAGPTGLDHDNSWMASIVTKYVGAGDVAINAGLHIGTIAYPLLKVGAEVYGFEPFRDTLKCAIHNCREFEERTHFFLAGLWHEPTTGHVNVCEGNLGASQVQPGGSIPLLTLDSFPFAHQKRPRVAICIFDAEGSELSILRGATQMIQTHHPALIVEVNKHALANHGATPEQLLKFISDLGYSYSVLQWQCDVNSEMFDVECVWKG